MKRFFVLILLFLYACTTPNEIAENDKLNNKIESEHFIYYYSDGDGTIDTVWQENYYDWMVSELGVTVKEKIKYFKYRDRDHMSRMTGRNTSGFAEFNYQIFTIWQADNHQSVHAIAFEEIGQSVSLFNEGLAVAHQADYENKTSFTPNWNGVDFDNIAFQYINSVEGTGETINFEVLVSSSAFSTLPIDVSYPLAGSFVTFLKKKYGIEKIKQFIQLSTYFDGEQKVVENFQSVFNVDLYDEFQSWRSFIIN